jgi:hypothetical protein
VGLKAVVGFALLAAVASCQSLIDLGDEPKLVQSEPSAGCGLRRAPGPSCEACLERNCCAKSLACAADATCKAVAEECLANCIGTSCINACLEGADETTGTYVLCGAACVDECTPHEDCATLGDCCPSVEPTLQGSCYRIARGEDQESCRTSLMLGMCGGGGGAPGQ